MSAATSRRPAPSRKEATHERIVETAARAIRRSGYGGAGVAEIMKEAGLTHGGFYAHFESREGMLAEAADRAGADRMALLARVAAAAPPNKALEAMLRAYLSKEHVEGVETGCPIAALGSEMPRQVPKVRRAATRTPVARLGAAGRARAGARHRGHRARRVGPSPRRGRPQALRRAARGGAEPPHPNRLIPQAPAPGVAFA